MPQETKLISLSIPQLTKRQPSPQDDHLLLPEHVELDGVVVPDLDVLRVFPVDAKGPVVAI